jgi:hypothetical protein
MTRTALSLSALVLCAASAQAGTVVIPGSKPAAAAPVKPAAAAPAKAGAPRAVAPPPGIPTNEVESLVRAAAVIEKSDGCEAAYLKYKEAGEKALQMRDHARAAQISGIVTNKMDKLQSCYTACQPNDRQRELFGTAKESIEAEPHRAGKILKQLLVGRSVDRCTFWSDARALLRTLPGQAEALDQDQADPCVVGADLQKAIADARDAVKKQRSAVADLNYQRGKLPGKVGELADLYRAMDQTRMMLVDLREGLMECDSIDKQLSADSTALKESIGLAQDMVLGTYKDQLASMSRKVRAAQAQLAQKDELLTTQIGEQEKLKKQLEGLSALSEELYNDLFALTQAESVSFSVEVEGRRIEQPIEEVRALVASEKKVLDTLSTRYPEYFKDGVNLEGLKRKKLVLEELSKMMKRFGSRSDQRLGYSRTMAELDATLAMMDKAIGVSPVKPPTLAEAPAAEKESSGSLPWFVGGGSVLAIAGLTLMRIRAANKS